MPYWGLVFTSIGFFIPALVARAKGMKKDTKLIGALATTSVLYHGTIHPIAQLIDITVAHFVSIQYAFNGIKRVLQGKHNNITGIILGGLSALMYYKKSLRIDDEMESRRWHMNVHLTAQAALLIFVYGGKDYGDGDGGRSVSSCNLLL